MGNLHERGPLGGPIKLNIFHIQIYATFYLIFKCSNYSRKWLYEIELRGLRLPQILSSLIDNFEKIDDFSVQ